MSKVNIIAAMSKPFWVLWGVEFWERFGFYGMQAITSLYFIKHLGFSQTHSMYLWGAFFSFVYGFIWVGGFIGDNYLGAKRCIFLGATTLMIGYISMAFATIHTVYFALATIVVGNALFKANPSSLISKLYKKGDPTLDSAMTLYYMAINIGSLFSMTLTPIIAIKIGWSAAFMLCAFGLLCGIISFYLRYDLLSGICTTAGKKPLSLTHLFIVIAVAIIAIFTVGLLLNYISLCYIIVAIVTTGGFSWFLFKAFKLQKRERTRMLIAFILILQGILFFVLYNQMPTSLTYLALHNIDNLVWGINIPVAEYQALNPLFIFILSPILAIIYQHTLATHATKFCIGMSLCAIAFLLLYFPQFTATSGIASPLWMVATYFFQSAGELLISALGLAMVAELCPASMSGFVMGIWFLTTMLAGPISAWVGSFTVTPKNIADLHLSLQVYCDVFGKLGLFTAFITLIMWSIRPVINRAIQHA